MSTIPISEIKIDARIRQEFDTEKLAHLTESIARIGLLHAPILHNGTLVCGGRRIKAISMLPVFGAVLKYQGVEIPKGSVPYTELGTSSTVAIMEAELEENLLREDLSVHEEAAARASLHRLRSTSNTTQTLTDTANELSKPGARLKAMDIRDALLIDFHADDPEVAKAKTRKEVMKVIERKQRTALNTKLAAEFKIGAASKSPHTLLEGDMVEWMQDNQGADIDVICTDPPYGVDAQNFNAQDGIIHEYDDTRETFERIINSIAVQGYGVCRDRAHAYIFHDFANWGFIRRCMETAGWSVWPRPIIWSKGNGLLARPDFGPRYTYECILFATKGDRKVKLVAPDVIDVRTLWRQKRGAEKSAILYYDLLARSVSPGDTVLDPCCGLGPIFPAANELNCKAIGIDIDPAAIGYAIKRMDLTLDKDNERREAE